MPLASRHLIAGCTWLSIMGAMCAAADWPTYRFGNARQGATGEKLAAPLKLHWSYRSPAPPRRAWSGPTGRTVERLKLRDRVRFDDAFHVAVVGDRVFFGSSADHKVYCRDLKTGKEIWSLFTGGPVRLAPTVAGGRVYFGSDDGFVYCVGAAGGKVLWKLRAGPAEEWILARGDMISRWPVRTGVLVDNGIAYFGAGIFPHEDVYLYAVEARTGKVLWKRDNISESDAGRDDLSPQGYLLASKSTLFVPSGRTMPRAFDRQTGRKLFKASASWRSTGVVGGARAILADGQLYAGGPHLYLAVDQKTAKIGFGYFEGKQMAVAGDAAFSSTGTRIARLDRNQYAVASRRRNKLERDIKTLSRSLRGAGKKAAAIRKKIADRQKEIAETQKIGVKWSTSSPLASSLVLTPELLFAGGEGGVAAFDVKTGKQVWSARVDGDARGLAVSNGRLLVSTTSGRIDCFIDANARAVNPAPQPGLVEFPGDTIRSDAARDILKNTGVKRGFCLVLGSEEGRLAAELAKRSQLKIYCIEPNEDKVARSRRRLSAAGLYGHRVVVTHADYSAIPFSNYFANLIVSDTSLGTGRIPGDPRQIIRHLKPLGGVVCFGSPGTPRAAVISKAAIRGWFAETRLGKDAKTVHNSGGDWHTLTRGQLPGAGNWSHLYGEPGNTASSEDTRVKGGLGVLWYGDPGPGEMVNRHDGAVGPLAAHGRLFVQGTDSVMAYDAYNGTFLWDRKNREALRTGVFQNYSPGNLVAGKDSLFVMVREKCFEFDAATGETRATHLLPPAKRSKTHQWGFAAYQDGVLYGTATVRKELAAKLRRRGRRTDDATDAIFAIDARTGKYLWLHQGNSISHRTLAIGPERVYFIDSSITSQQRQAILAEDKSKLKKLTGKARELAEMRLKKQDLRMAVALDARTGGRLWARPVDVTDCSKIGIGGGELTLMHKNNVLVLCGANANGHYWNQFMAGDFSRRRLVALASDDGRKLWAKDANYRHRPIIVEDEIVAEPWAFDLYTGVQKTRPHPLTGQDVPWSMIRPGHHCGMLTGCPGMLMFRSGYTGFYDRATDSGTRHFAGHRLGCWINAIPANGLVMIPEASAGCVCLFSIAATITMEPRPPRRPWTIYSAVGSRTPVKHMHLNLGAPGDRKDARGTIWLAYPRPHPHKRTGLDLAFTLKEQKLSGGGFQSTSARTRKIQTDGTPWIYTSQARGVRRLSLPLLGKKDKPGVYTVKLHFAELNDSAKAGQRVFDVKLQGQTAISGLDVFATTGGGRKSLVRTVTGVAVNGSLVVELTSNTKSPNSAQMPILSAIEVVRTGGK